MNIRQALCGIVLCGMGLMVLVARAADPASMTTADIAVCMRGNIVDRGSLRDFQITATDREAKANTLKVKLFWKPAKGAPIERMTLQVLEPDAYAGTSYLMTSNSRNEQLYVYLPSLERVQAMNTDDATQRLWGSDFTFADVKQVQGLLLDGDTRRLADTVVNGRTAFQLDTTTDKVQTGYTHVTTYVDTSTCTVLKSDLYSDAGAAPHKVLEADLGTLIEVEPYWLVLGYRMRDLRAGTMTDLKLSDVFLLEFLPESMFTPEGFYKPQE